MVSKLLLKNNQASSTDGMMAISFQDTQARFDSDEGWSFDHGRITDEGNEAVIAEILIENSRGVFGGQVGQDIIYEGAHVYRFMGVPGWFLDNLCEIECIKLRL